MKLENILSPNNKKEEIKNFIHMEQNINEGSPSGFTGVNTVSNNYIPINNNSFKVPILNIEKELCNIFYANPSIDLQKEINSKKEEIMFCLHPDLYNTLNINNPNGFINVYPTSSSRTVLVDNMNYLYFAKLHYPGLLGRVNREMTDKRVNGAYLISKELDYLSQKGILSPYFSYLPESIGITTKLDGNDLGISYREFLPRPNIDDKRYLIPFFSLFSNDKYDINSYSLLTQILKNYDNPSNVFIDKIIYPLLESFRSIVEDGGMWPENHAQNILLEINGNGEPSRIVHRDLYEIYIDIQIRKRLGLHNSYFQKVMDNEINKNFYYKQKSFLFDFKLGEYTIKPLINDYCFNFGDDKEKIRNIVIDIFKNISTELLYLFNPYNKYYYFPPIETTYVNGQPVYLEGEGPEFR